MTQTLRAAEHKSLTRSVCQHVEAELHAYPYREKEIGRLRMELLHPHRESDSNIGGGRSSIRQDPTAYQAIALATSAKLHHMERVMEAIRATYEQLPPQMQQFVQVKYWNGSHRLSCVGVCLKLDISERTYTRWRKQIVQLIADQLGW